MYHRKKRGQITFFIVVGIIILIVVALMLFFREETITEETEAIFEQQRQDLPSGFQPVRDYVEQCLQRIGRRAVENIGLQGGYLALDNEEPDFELTALSSGFKKDTIGDAPTEKQAFKVAEGWYGLYWHHMSKPNDLSEGVQFEHNVPLLDARTEIIPNVHVIDNPRPASIQNQIKRFVDEKLPVCLGTFEGFKQQGMEITKKGDPDSRVEIPAKGVIIALHMPLVIEKEGTTQRVDTFRTELDLNLRDMYDYAVSIFIAIAKVESLSQFTRNVVSGYGRLEGDIPPMYSDELSIAPRIWTKTLVETKLRELFEGNVKKLRVIGSSGGDYDFNSLFEQFGDGIKAGQLSNTFSVKPDIRQPAYSVDFTYSREWPIYLDVGGGEVITSTDSGVGLKIMSFLGFQRYQLPFDVSIPILIEITDPYAFNGDGYLWSFGMEGNMRNNEVMDSNFEEMESIPPMVSGGRAHLCDLDQRNSGETTIEVVGTDGRPIDRAMISWISGVKCPIDQTNIKNRQSVWKGKLPVGIGGIEITHPDYLTTKVPFISRARRPGHIKIVVPKFVDKIIRGKKYLMKKDGRIPLDIGGSDSWFDNWVLEEYERSTRYRYLDPTAYVEDRQREEFGYTSEVSKDDDVEDIYEVNYVRNPIYETKKQWKEPNMGRLHELTPKERMIITLEREPQDNIEEKYETGALMVGTGTGKLRVAPGTYKIGITVINDEVYEIPVCPECICDDVDEGVVMGIGGGDCENWVDFPDEPPKPLENVVESDFTITHTFGNEIYEDNTILFRAIVADFAGIPMHRRMLKDIQIIDHLRKTIAPKYKERLAPKMQRRRVQT